MRYEICSYSFRSSIVRMVHKNRACGCFECRNTKEQEKKRFNKYHNIEIDRYINNRLITRIVFEIWLKAEDLFIIRIYVFCFAFFSTLLFLVRLNSCLRFFLRISIIIDSKYRKMPEQIDLPIFDGMRYQSKAYNLRYRIISHAHHQVNTHTHTQTNWVKSFFLRSDNKHKNNNRKEKLSDKPFDVD